MKNIIFLFFLTSCAAYVRTQSTKMMSPESHGGLGKGQLELRLEAQKRDHLDFANDQTKNAIDRADAPYSLAGLGELGIFKRLDLFMQPHLASSTIYGAKYQLIGASKAEAKSGNFSTSVIAGFGGTSKTYSSSGDLDQIFNDNIKRIELDSTHQEFGVISGYRWGNSFLHYANVIYQQESLNGKVTNNSGTLTNAKFKYNMDGVIYSTGFILYFAKAHWKVDLSHYVSDWTHTQKQTVNSANTAVGFDW